MQGMRPSRLSLCLLINNNVLLTERLQKNVELTINAANRCTRQNPMSSQRQALSQEWSYWLTDHHRCGLAYASLKSKGEETGQSNWGWKCLTGLNNESFRNKSPLHIYIFSLHFCLHINKVKFFIFFCPPCQKDNPPSASEWRRCCMTSVVQGMYLEATHYLSDSPTQGLIFQAN